MDLIKIKKNGEVKMKVYEMKPNEIGETVETTEAIIVTLHNPDRVLIISRKDMVVQGASVESIKQPSSLRGAVVTRLGHGVIYKNVLDEFRHAKNRDEMTGIIKRFYPGNKRSSVKVMTNLYLRAVRQGVVSVPMEHVALSPKTVSTKKKMGELKYLPILEDSVLGKTLNSSVALAVYKIYGVRLWNNVMADIQSRVNSAKENIVDSRWLEAVFYSVLNQYKIPYSKTKRNAYIMFMKGVNLIRSNRQKDKKVLYEILRSPAIPGTVST